MPQPHLTGLSESHQTAFCSSIKIPFCYTLSFPIFHVEGCLFWLSGCPNDIGARAVITDSETISPADQPFPLKNTDHAILVLSLRYGSYLMGGGKLPIKISQVKFATAVIGRAVGAEKKNKKCIWRHNTLLKISKIKDMDMTHPMKCPSGSVTGGITDGASRRSCTICSVSLGTWLRCAEPKYINVL